MPFHVLWPAFDPAAAALLQLAWKYDPQTYHKAPKQVLSAAKAVTRAASALLRVQLIQRRLPWLSVIGAGTLLEEALQLTTGLMETALQTGAAGAAPEDVQLAASS